jgi:cytidine deaminase
VLSEFSLDTLVIMADGQGSIVQEMTVGELLPEAFTPAHLT